MIWICAGNSIYNVEMFFILLSRAYIEPQPFLLLVLPSQCRGGGAQKDGRGHSWDS